MLGLTTLVATLLCLRARTCMVLACLATMLFAASTASAQPAVEAQTRVWDFSSAAPLHTWLDADATPRLHPENQSSSAQPASDSPHAARGAAGTGRALAEAIPQGQKVLLRQLFRTGGKGGVEGANAALKAIRAGDLSVVPQGLSRTTLQQYLQIARAAPATQTGVQQVRIEIIEALLKVVP